MWQGIHDFSAGLMVTTLFGIDCSAAEGAASVNCKTVLSISLINFFYRSTLLSKLLSNSAARNLSKSARG